MNITQNESELTFITGVELINGTTLQLPIANVVPLFVVGPNGAGKSGLMMYLYRMNHQNAVRISAHRQTWMESNAVPFSPQEKVNTQNHVKSQDVQPKARWHEWNGAVRSGLIISDLIDADHLLSRRVRDAVRVGDITNAQSLARDNPPLDVISDLLAGSGIPIKLSIEENSSIVASKRGGPTYSIASLSDGERAALLIAGTILTAKAGSLILVDEPERHLHSSIVTPLLLQLFAKRIDCSFVVSTHELSLPVSCLNSRTALVRDSVAENDNFSRWDIDILEAGLDIDDPTREAVIGARRKILFIEGTQASLDKPLYEILFPGVTIFPRASCRDVEHAVKSLRDSSAVAWVTAYGIVDQDQLSSEKKSALETVGVFALSVYSVESLYYHPSIVERVAQRQSSIIGVDADAMIEKAWQDLLSTVLSEASRLAARMTEQTVTDQINFGVPNWKNILDGENVTISVDAQVLFQAEKMQLEKWIADKSIDKIVSRYPIRQTNALGVVVNALQFKSIQQYEAAVRKLVLDTPAIKSMLLGHFSVLPNIIN